MKKITMTFVLILTLMLTACTGEDPAELMYEHLEEAVQIERAVEEKQGPLTEAETNEYQLYEEMLETSDLDELEVLSNQAIDSAETRQVLLEEEKKVIDEAFEEFEKSKEYVSDIEEEDLREQAEKMIETMENRYATYQELYDQYMSTIGMDIKLYSMIYEEELTIEELQEQHETVNEAYGEINRLNEQYNEYTAIYNEDKRKFYEIAEMNVAFEDA